MSRFHIYFLSSGEEALTAQWNLTEVVVVVIKIVGVCIFVFMCTRARGGGKYVFKVCLQDGGVFTTKLFILNYWPRLYKNKLNAAYR